MTAPSGIVTPEAVVLDFDTAGLGSRLIAEALDLAVQTTAAVVVVTAAAVVGSTPALVVDYVAIFLILFGYPAAMETLWRGRTLGKAALGLRVVTVEGAPIRFRHAAIRAALSLVDIYLLSGVPGILAILLTKRSQRLGDLVAGTIVLRERTAVGMPEPARFSVPPQLETYVSSLDVAALTGPEYAAVRSFLLRAGQLAPDHRDALARQLAGPLAARLGHTPPPHLSPEWYLVCVASAGQRRAGSPVRAAGAGRRSAWDPAELADPHWRRSVPAPEREPAPRQPGGFAPPE